MKLTQLLPFLPVAALAQTGDEPPPPCTENCFTDPPAWLNNHTDRGLWPSVSEANYSYNPVFTLGNTIHLDFTYNGTRPYRIFLVPYPADPLSRSVMQLGPEQTQYGHVNMDVKLEFPFEKPFPPMYYLRITDNVTYADVTSTADPEMLLRTDFHTRSLNITDPTNPNPGPPPATNLFINPRGSGDDMADYWYSWWHTPNSTLLNGASLMEVGDNITIEFDAHTEGQPYDVSLEEYLGYPTTRPNIMIAKGMKDQGLVRLNWTVAAPLPYDWPMVYYFRVSTNQTFGRYLLNADAGNRTDFHSWVVNVTDPNQPSPTMNAAQSSAWYYTATTSDTYTYTYSAPTTYPSGGASDGNPDNRVGPTSLGVGAIVAIAVTSSLAVILAFLYAVRLHRKSRTARLAREMGQVASGTQSHAPAGFTTFRRSDTETSGKTALPTYTEALADGERRRYSRVPAYEDVIQEENEDVLRRSPERQGGERDEHSH